MPWQAPTGGANCDKCNEDSLKPCSEYRCSSLGKSCELLNPNDANPVCIYNQSDDGNPPAISPGIIATGYKFQDKEIDRVKIRDENSNCIPEFTSVLFSLETNEFAQCKFEYEKTDNYDAMSEFFLEQNSYTKNHTTAFIMPSIEALEAEYNITVTGDVREKLGDLDMYVRCKDKDGNENKKEYAVNFCIKSGPDLTPAQIIASKPANGATKRFGVTELPLTVYSNEPADCKYDPADKKYDEMAEIFVCETGLNDASLYGWPCQTVLKNLTNQDKKVYIRCKDQPWLTNTENESKRNINPTSYEYVLKSSTSELKINSVLPQGESSHGFEPITVNLEAETSGGIKNGEAICYYDFKKYSKEIPFRYMGTNHNKQVFDMMTRGSYNLFVTCEDIAGNEAYGNATFSLVMDTQAPIVVRAYNDGSNIKLITNEDAECYYDLKRCVFNLANATSMTTALSKEHFAPWNTDLTYHVKCKDVWGNTNKGCAIVVSPSSIFS